MSKHKNPNTDTEPEDELREKTAKQPEQDPYSYLVIALYTAYGFIIGTSLTPFTPIFKCLDIAFGIKQSQVLQSTGFFLAGKIIFSVFAGIIMKIMGLRYGLLSCLAVFTLGVLFRFGIVISWWLVMLGQLICGIAATMIIVSQLQLCQIWFPNKVRGLYLAVTSISMILGGAFGLFFPLLFLGENETNTETIRAGVFKLNMTNFIIIGSLVVTHFLLFFEKPRDGYFNGSNQKQLTNVIDKLSESSSRDKLEVMIEHKDDKADLSSGSLNGTELKKAYVKLFWEMMAQYNFKVCLVVYLLFSCINITFSSNINFIFSNFGYAAVYAGSIVGGYIVGGFIGAATFFKLLMNSPRNVKNYVLFIAGGLVIFVSMIISLFSRIHVVVLLIIAFFYGFFTMAGIPIILEFFLRLVQGVPFTFVNGIICFFAQTLTSISVFIFSAIYDRLGAQFGCTSVLVSICILYLIAIYMIAKIRP